MAELRPMAGVQTLPDGGRNPSRIEMNYDRNLYQIEESFSEAY